MTEKSTSGGVPGRCALATTAVLLALLLVHFSSAGATLAEARKLFLSGDYPACIALATAELKKSSDPEEWHLLLGQALLESGKYSDALMAASNALAHDRWNVRIRWQARAALLANGKKEAADQMVDSVLRLVSNSPRDFRDASSLVVFARAALLRGADPKSILDNILEAARKADPGNRDAHLARGQLALEKHDYALAAKAFQEGLKQLPDDPDLHFGSAQAFAPSDPELTHASVEAALGINSNHVGTLLLLVDHCIDAEDFKQAAALLERIGSVNPAHPDAWAYSSVLEHFKGRTEPEDRARENGLKFWPTNPRVDHLIGRKLSQNYRFAEGAEHQRAALRFDPTYLPAKAQLAQDLLRLGEEAEGWKLAEEVHRLDAYDAEAYNLATLHDVLARFSTLTNDFFVARMSTNEAEIYGPKVLDLLTRAKTTLCQKYGLRLSTPTLVELFPEQKDFAVRTFGMPGNPGYLGVCFGSVITANSPAANPGMPVNWEAVLWHEFCHVVTLQLTHNKMPRWLSEGISVYEESQANPAWGQRMLPSYREMIFNGELTPISKLSGAFLSPPSDLHLQFAYYESSLVVEFLVSRFGAAGLRSILEELAKGTEINHAIELHSAPISELEKGFDAFARARALQLGSGLDWEKPAFAAARRRGSGPRRTDAPPPPVPSTPGDSRSLDDVWDAWAKMHPTNFWALSRKADLLLEEKKWSEARPILETILRFYPEFTGEDSAYRQLAAAYRALGETNLEFRTLAAFAEKDDKAPDAYLRLMDLSTASQDWTSVEESARRFLAVNPLVPQPYRFLARATEAQNNFTGAIGCWRNLLRLDPSDPADVHFNLARLLHRVGNPEAKRQVLQALEDAPRHPAALALLLQIHESETARGGAATGASTP